MKNLLFLILILYCSCIFCFSQETEKCDETSFIVHTGAFSFKPYKDAVTDTEYSYKDLKILFSDYQEIAAGYRSFNRMRNLTLFSFATIAGLAAFRIYENDNRLRKGLNIGIVTSAGFTLIFNRIAQNKIDKTVDMYNMMSLNN